ncbi:MAG: hypothetical protein CMJ64_18240 [Planctomycetaceae bacterium]|nr:hypothetical protein [Planctomycetaceae bacterium]
MAHAPPNTALEEVVGTDCVKANARKDEEDEWNGGNTNGSNKIMATLRYHGCDPKLPMLPSIISIS